MISLIDDGTRWASVHVPSDLPADSYCATRDVFTVRLEILLRELEKTTSEDPYLLAAVVGEIGNNAFDHNLGNWPDIPGVYFAHDAGTKTIVLADRGQGVRTTISRVLPTVKDDKEALFLAFTQTISGRFPEKRGNGLKFVDSIIKEKSWTLRFQSGEAQIIRAPNTPFVSTHVELKIRGVLAILTY